LQFVFEVINFDNSTGGLVVIDDLRYSGTLCDEMAQSSTTTINPPQIKQLFSLQYQPQTIVVSRFTVFSSWDSSG
uniref:CUB domain-containing protein n=1 Tax=Gongylonema pulchrum TaxID=637853 RepID=A0A183DBC0_9BILA